MFLNINKLEIDKENHHSLANEKAEENSIATAIVVIITNLLEGITGIVTLHKNTIDPRNIVIEGIINDLGHQPLPTMKKGEILATKKTTIREVTTMVEETNAMTLEIETTVLNILEETTNLSVNTHPIDHGTIITRDSLY